MFTLFRKKCFSCLISCFAQLFGWDLKASWQTANQNLCDALRLVGRLKEAHQAYKYMMDICDEATKASCLDWSTGKCLVCHQATFIPHMYFTQLSRKNAMRFMSRGVTLPLLQAHMTGLSSYTLQRSILILRPIASLQTAAKQSWGRCYGMKRSSMLQRYYIVYRFVATQAHSDGA